jgi:hypothetical protein
MCEGMPVLLVLNMNRFSLLAVLLWYCTSASGQQEYLSYPQSAFDSDTCCWRELSASQNYLAAATLLTDYLKHGNARNKHSLRWHSGQMYAMAGDTRNAVRYFRKTTNVLYKWFGGEDARAWYFFAKGTIAFVQRRERHLDAIIQKWQPLPADRNYNELLTLRQNWMLPYEEAFLKCK